MHNSMAQTPEVINIAVVDVPLYAAMRAAEAFTGSGTQPVRGKTTCSFIPKRMTSVRTRVVASVTSVNAHSLGVLVKENMCKH